jgi:hypothetical protein
MDGRISSGSTTKHAFAPLPPFHVGHRRDELLHWKTNNDRPSRSKSSLEAS